MIKKIFVMVVAEQNYIQSTLRSIFGLSHMDTYQFVGSLTIHNIWSLVPSP